MNRPLSPHLQVYRWQITSVLSILHRLTGVGLSLSIPFLVISLGAIAEGKESFEMLQTVCRHPLGQLFCLSIIWAFYYHLLNGIRHLAWDSGYGFSLPVTYRTGWGVVVLSFGLTFATWTVF